MGSKKRKSSAVAAVPESAASVSPTAAGKKKKTKLEKRKLAPEHQPSFNFALAGFRNGRQVTIKDLRELTLHLLNAPSSAPSLPWLQVNNRHNVDKVVTLFIPGLSHAALGLQAVSGNPIPQPLAPGSQTSKLPVFSQLFSHYAPTKAPGDRYHLHSVLQTFTSVPMSDKDKAKRDLTRQQKFEAASDPSMFLLAPEAMLESLYHLPFYPVLLSIHSPDIPRHRGLWLPPGPGTDLPLGWLETPQCSTESDIKCLALDCEMVKTENGQELARITVVNRKLQVVYDTYVQPAAPVIDYSTQWSGITPKDLLGVTTTLRDVQQKLATLIDYKTILVGHSLENDLRAVKIAHPWVIDTALIYQHTRGPPFKPSLKWLAQKWLQKEIQASRNASADPDVVIGHDSEEDARTAMELLNLKMVKGPSFGEFVADQEVIFERVAKSTPPKTSVVVDHGTPGQWHGAKATKSVPCTNDQEATEAVLAELPTHDYVFARFLDLSHALGWSQPSSSVQARMPFRADTGPADQPSAVPTDADDRLQELKVQDAHNHLNESILRMYQALPPRTALVIFSGHGDPRRMGQLLSKKNKFDRLWKTVARPELIAQEDKFMEAEDRELQEEAEKAKLGMAFLACKEKTLSRAIQEKDH